MERRLIQHQQGEGADYTKNRRPVTLVYCEEFERVDDAFYREKQVQGWSRAKKKALIDGRFDDLPALSASTSSATNGSTTTVPERRCSELAENVEEVEGKGGNAAKQARIEIEKQAGVTLSWSTGATLSWSKGESIVSSGNAKILGHQAGDENN